MNSLAASLAERHITNLVGDLAVAGLGAVLFLGALGWLVRDSVRRARLDRRAVEATAKVVGNERHHTGGSQSRVLYRPLVRFNTADGRKMRNVPLRDDDLVKPLEQGRMITVFYDSEAPEQVSQLRRDRVGIALRLFVGIPFCLFVVWATGLKTVRVIGQFIERS